MQADVFLYNQLKKHIIARRIKREYTNGPISLEKIIELKTWYNRFGLRNPLFPSFKKLSCTGSSLDIVELKDLLHDDIIGEWALDKSIIEFLWNYLTIKRPSIIIECGAGISTIIIAKYASLYSTEDNKITVYSIEQDMNVKSNVEKRLHDLGLQGHTYILYAPTSATGGYTIDINELQQKLLSQKADLLFIDGPAGPDGCRNSTLPQLSRFCNINSVWLLDDALRDCEIDTLKVWSDQPGVIIDGIHPIGKGLAIGRITDPEIVKL